MLKRVRLDEIAIVAILMFFGVSGAIPGIAPNQANEMTGAAATGLQKVVGIGSQVLVNGAIIALLFHRRQLFARRQATLRWASALAVWALISLLWSADRLLTARRVVPFALATCFGMLLAFAMPTRRLMLLLQVTFALLACWSAVLALGFPAVGLDASTGHGGDWQGVFTQKNACGRAMVFALASVLACGKLSPPRLILALLFSGELVLSGSRGAWLLGTLLLAAMIVLRASCRLDRKTRTALYAAVAGFSLAAGALLVTQFATFSALLGRDATLTGRTAIWHEVWLAILQRPALGYGFSAFWHGAQGVSWNVVVALQFVLFHAHNGFLEIWLELGATGLLLFAFGFARASVLLWPELRAGHFEAAAWPFAMLLLIALYDVDENTLLSFNGLFWVLYAGALMRIEMLAADRRIVREAFAERWEARPTPFDAKLVRPSASPRLHAALPPARRHDSEAAPAAAFLATAPGSGRSPWL